MAGGLKMEISFEQKKWFKKTHIEIDSRQTTISVPNRRSNLAIKGLMRTALKQGCSVITYGAATNFFEYIADIAPNQLSVIEYKELMDDAMLPYISGSCEKAERAVEECFRDYVFDGRYRYLSSRRKGQQFRDPNTHQTFFQIKAGDITKQKVITEAVLVNIIAQSLYKEPLHEVILFLDMPFRPVTTTALDYLGRIHDTSNLSLICMYLGEVVVKSPYEIDSDGQILSFKALNKEFLIPHEQIFKD